MQKVPPSGLRLGRLPRLAVPLQTKEAQVNDRTKYPRGSPRDILVRLRRIEKEVRQQLADVSSVNDNNPNFADEPMDIGRYIVRLKIIRGVIAKVREVIKAGEPKLPRDILDQLREPW